MKTNSVKLILMLFALANFGVYQAKSQITYLSGTGTNNCGTTAGTSGTNVTFIGCGAGYSNNNGMKNTFIGKEAGYQNINGHENVAVGYRALYSQSFYDSTDSYNVGVGNNSLYSDTVGIKNTAIGHETLKNNISGNYNTVSGYQSGIANTTASYNTFEGSLSGYANTTGHDNVFSGYQSGYANTTASYNTFEGSLSGYSNTTGTYNTFSGYKAGNLNVTGGQNTYFGYVAGMKSTSSYNAYVGYAAGYNNTSGDQNTFMGQQAAYYNTTGSKNTFIGLHTGWANTTGSNNTLLGYGADLDSLGRSNATALGNGAIARKNNAVYIGNAAISGTYIVAGASYYGSDGRFKFNIKENVKGLDFINKLRPVTYQMNTKQLDEFLIQNMPDSVKIMHQNGMDFTTSTNKIHSGFIAQEVEKAANDVGFVSSIVSTPNSSNDMYSLSYSEIVVPLVKAVQEQQKMIEELQAKVTGLQETGQSAFQKQNESITTLQVELANKNSVVLYQNEPNPFGNETVIRYFIPENMDGKTYVVFYDMYGKEMNSTEITTKGFGNLNVNTENLTSGIYSYSIIINDKTIDTKKMIRNK